jgi:hypothetical protein
MTDVRKKTPEYSRAGLGVLALALLGIASAGCVAEVSTDNPEYDEAEQELLVPDVHFRTVLGSRYLGAQNNGGGAVVATATTARAWETFTVDDLNGGSLESGDQVRIRAGSGQYFPARSTRRATTSAAGRRSASSRRAALAPSRTARWWACRRPRALTCRPRTVGAVA